MLRSEPHNPCQRLSSSAERAALPRMLASRFSELLATQRTRESQDDPMKMASKIHSSGC